MNKISLTKGAHCIVDESLFIELNKYKWHLSKDGYAARWQGKAEGFLVKKYIFMHNQIMGPAPVDKMIDHLNRNKLDNRMANLEFKTNQENSLNKDLTSSNKSGYRGVHWCKVYKKWMAQIKVKGKQIYLGRFDNKKDAAIAYNTAAKTFHKEHANLNVIDNAT